MAATVAKKSEVLQARLILFMNVCLAAILQIDEIIYKLKSRTGNTRGRLVVFTQGVNVPLKLFIYGSLEFE